MLTTVPLPDLRRVAATLTAVRNRSIIDASLTTDLRQLRLTLDDGEMLVLRVEADDFGRAYLEADVVRPGEHHQDQLELDANRAGEEGFSRS
jgi:hypothetical protein